MNTAFSKWLVTIGMAVGAGIVAYSQVHKGPPIHTEDWWNLLVVTLTVTGFGGVAPKLINKQIDKSQGN